MSSTNIPTHEGDSSVCSAAFQAGLITSTRSILTSRSSDTFSIWHRITPSGPFKTPWNLSVLPQHPRRNQPQLSWLADITLPSQGRAGPGSSEPSWWNRNNAPPPDERSKMSSSHMVAVVTTCNSHWQDMRRGRGRRDLLAYCHSKVRGH
jgi:hypothetical protein